MWMRGIVSIVGWGCEGKNGRFSRTFPIAGIGGRNGRFNFQFGHQAVQRDADRSFSEDEDPPQAGVA